MTKALGIGFVIGASVSSTVASAFSTVESRLKRTRQAMYDASREAKSMKTALELRDKRDALVTRVRESGGADKEALQELKKISVQYRTAKTAALGYKVAVGQWAERHEQAAHSVELTYQRVKKLEALQAQTSRRNELRSSMVGTAAQVMSVAAPVRMAMDFESAMADAAKTIEGMRDASGRLTPAYYEMETAVKSLGRSLPLTHTEIASLFAAGGQQGMRGATELREFATLAAHMSVAFGMSTSEAAEAIGGYRSALKLTMPEARSLLDLMNRFANTTSASEKGIADVVRRIGSLGNLGGVAAKPVTALAATLDAMKVSPEVAATGIKNLILALTAGEAATRGQQEAFARLGIDTVTLAKQMQTDGPAAIVSVLEAVKQLPRDQQLSIMQQIFGKESLGSIAPLLDSLEQVKKNMAVVSEESTYAGAMQEEFENRSKTTANALVLFRNKAAELAITVGSVLLPPLVSIMDVAGGWASAMADLAQRFPMLSKVIVGAAAGFVLMKTVSLGTLYVWSSLRSAATGLSMLLSVLRRGSIAHAVVTRSMTAAQWLFNAAMTANPVGLVVTAVAGLAAGLVLLYNTCEPVRTAFDALFGFIGEKISLVAGMFRGLGSMLRSAGEWLGIVDADEAAPQGNASASRADTAGPPLAAMPQHIAPQTWTPPDIPSSAAPPVAHLQGSSAPSGVSLNMQFALNGMPDASFAQGVVKALRERSSDLERIVSDIVNNQARLAYGR